LGYGEEARLVYGKKIMDKDLKPNDVTHTQNWNLNPNP